MSTLTLNDIIESQLSVATADALATLIHALRNKHGSSIQSILFYGSCLRSGDAFDGLVDLYLVVDNYRAFYARPGRALANWLLPPNVFYMEAPVGERIIRAKYAVLSEQDFLSGTSRRWFHSYLWGRFTQPVAQIYRRDKQAGITVIKGLSQAICTFLSRTIPRLPASGSVRDLWVQGLQLSYQAELRTESGQRATTLVEQQLDYYTAVTQAAAEKLRYPLLISEAKQYRSSVPAITRFLSRISWPLRQWQGKFLSVMRLLKALFTFEGGLDYIAWKLERHSGQNVEIPDRVRRYPLIFIWGLFWRLYRRGIFR